MNWLKTLTNAFTREGRKTIAREALAKYLTPEKLTGYALDGVNKILAKIKNGEKLDATACNVARAADLAAELATAIRDGVVTEDEAAAIRASAESLFGGCITQERLDALVAKVVDNVL